MTSFFIIYSIVWAFLICGTQNNDQIRILFLFSWHWFLSRWEWWGLWLVNHMKASSVQLNLLPISVFAGSQFLNPSALRSLQTESVSCGPGGKSLGISPCFACPLGRIWFPVANMEDALRSTEGSRVQALVPILAQGVTRPFCGGDCSWCQAARGERQLCCSLSRYSTASVFLSTFKLHAHDFRKQKHILLAKYCIKWPENRSGYKETFLGRVEEEEENNSCVFFTALEQHLS